MQNVYVLGTGMIKFGRYPTKTVPELGGEAAILALKDAGVGIKDVEMFACGNLYQSNAMVGQRILQQTKRDQAGWRQAVGDRKHRDTPGIQANGSISRNATAAAASLQLPQRMRQPRGGGFSRALA